MASTLVRISFQVDNISHPFCTKLSQTASFLLNASVLFFRTKRFVQNPCRDILSLFKWQNISAKPASILIHISSKRNSANGEFLSLKNCFVSSLSSTRRKRTRSLDSQFMSVWRCSCCKSILYHSVFNNLELKGRLLIS